MAAKQKENTERINVFLPPDILEKVKEAAKVNGMTVSGYVRMLVMQYFTKKK